MNPAFEDLQKIIRKKEVYLLSLDNTRQSQAIEIEIKVLKNFLNYIHLQENTHYHEVHGLQQKIEKLNMDKWRLEMILLNHGVIDFTVYASRTPEMLFQEFTDLVKSHAFIMPYGLRPQFMPEALHDARDIYEHFERNLQLLTT